MKAMKATTERKTDPLVDFSSPGEKRKRKLKPGEYEPDTMVLIPAVPPESVTQYSINLPSANKDTMLDEMDMLRNITLHLNQIVHRMEHVYVKDDETEGEGEEEEEETPPKEDLEDMTSFLICCSQLTNQLETAVREEKVILESLLQWFEKEVHEMEEIGEEEIIPDWQVPLADKSITDNINKLMNRIERLEELKGRVQELPKLIQISTPKQEKRRPVSPAPPTTKDPKSIIEELATKHATEDVMNMVEVFQEDAGPQTIESMNNRMLEIMKVFERQTNKLHRVSNEQDVLEGKLQKIQHEFRKLAEEKEIMEDELQKMKESSEGEKLTEGRKKLFQKLEKTKADEKQVAPEKAHMQKRPSIHPKQKDIEHLKTKEELAKAQANILSLEQEKKMLEEMLQKALEETGKVKIQLAEIPPNIPDWEFPSTLTGEEDLTKKDKKPKGELGKSQDISTAPQTKDVKHKKKGAAHPDVEKGPSSPEKESLGVTENIRKLSATSEGTAQLTDKKTEESKKKVKAEGKSETVESKGAIKHKDSVEMKNRRSTSKGAGKAVPELSPLPPVEEMPYLSDSTKAKEQILPVTLEKSSRKIPSPDSQIRETEIPISPQIDEGMPITKERASPLLSEERDSLTLLSAEPKKIIEESKTVVSGITPVPELTKIMERIPTAFTPEEAQATVTMAKERIPIPYATEDRSLTLEKAPSVEGLPKLDAIGFQEKEVKKMAEKGRVLLENLESNLKGLQEAEGARPTLQDVGKEINTLSKNRSQLLARLELNMKNLEEAQAIAATKPSEMNENKVKELLQQRELLAANLETNQQDLQSAKVLEASLKEKDKHEKEINELSEKRKALLANLDSNLENLQEAQALAAAEPGSVSDEKLKELTEETKLLTADLESNLQDLQRAQAYAPGLPEERRLTERELYKLSEKKQLLLKDLESKQKELQEAQALAAIQPGSVSEYKLQELAEQQKHLTADLEATAQDIRVAEHHVFEKAVTVQPERELYDLSMKKQLLLKDLEAKQKELQEAQALAAINPGSISEHKLQELAEQQKHLTADLEAMQEIFDAERHAFEKAITVQSPERELYELSEKKEHLLKNLEFKQKELQEAQALAATQPGSISEYKLRELAEQQKHLSAELEETKQDIRDAERRSFEKAIIVQPPERELYKLSMKKQLLLKDLESKQKELQEAQALAAIQPGSISEHKLQELVEQQKLLTADLEATARDIRIAEHHVFKEAVTVQPAERELYELSMKKELLLKDLESKQIELQEAQALAAIQPGSISEHKLQELAEQQKLLTVDLEATARDIRVAEHRVFEEAVTIRPAERELFNLSMKKQFLLKDLESKQNELQEAQALAAIQPGSVSERELYELSMKKQLLLKDLESKQNELQEAQALAAIQPGSVSEHKLQELADQQKRLTADLEATTRDIHDAELRVFEKAFTVLPDERELYELSEKKRLLLKNLESSQKELQEAQALAATQPGSFSAHKLQELAEQQKRLTVDLEETVHDIQEAEYRAYERAVTVQPTEKELYELSAKKQLLLKKIESKQKELQEAQALAATQPGRISEHKLQKLAEQQKRLTSGLEATMHNIQETEHRSFERAVKPAERTLYELSQKKQLLLENLESNLKELQEAQALALTQPGSISEQKLQELAEQRRQLNAELEATVHDIQEVQLHSSIGTVFVRPSIRELYQLSEKKQHLLEHLESNWKELQEAQDLAATQPGSVSEHKLEELAEKREHLTAALEATVKAIQKAERCASLVPSILRPAERELYELSEKEQLLLENLGSNWKELQEAQALAAIQPGTISKHKLQELTKQRQRLTADLEATMADIQIVRRASGSGAYVRPIVRELYELYDKKQNLMEQLETIERELQEAQTLADTQPGSVSEHKLQELVEERQRLKADIDATVKDIQKAQHHVSESPIIMQFGERDLYELSEKKQQLLESLKELQEAQAAAATQSGNISAEELQELAEQRKRLTADLVATVHYMQKAQEQPSKPTVTSDELAARDLHELFKKQQFLLKKLDSIKKKLEAAQVLEAVQPGSISENKLLELVEQRKRLTADLAAIVQEIQKAKHLASEEALIAPSDHKLQALAKKRKQMAADLEATLDNIQKAKHVSERDLIAQAAERELHELFMRKQLLLEDLETNLKDIQEVYALEATQPASISNKIMQEFNERTKHLSAKIEEVVQDIKKMQVNVSEIDGMKKPIERNVNQLFQKKKLFLKRLESNLKFLQRRQKLAAAHPESLNVQKMQQVAEQRRLLTAGLEAITQDLEDVWGFAPEKARLIKSKERILEELSQKRKLILENMALNSEDLKEAQSLPDAQTDGIDGNKVKELIEERRLLAAGLEAIVQDIQEIQTQISDKGGLLKPSQKELSKKRISFFKDLDSNLKLLKHLQALEITQSEHKMQELTKRKKLLIASLEAIIEDMQETQHVMGRPDGRKGIDLIELSILESKLNELQQIGALSDIQLDSMRRKVHELRKQRQDLIDRWEVPLHDVRSISSAELEEYGLSQKEIKELIRGKNLFSYLKSSIKELQQKGIVPEDSVIEKRIHNLSSSRSILDEYLVAVPLELLQPEPSDISIKSGTHAEQLAKQKVLAAKLEANIKELQSLKDLKITKISVPVREKSSLTEPSDHQVPYFLKPLVSGLQIQTTKAPVLKRPKPGHIMAQKSQDLEIDASPILTQEDKILKMEKELAFKRQLQQFPLIKTSLPGVPSAKSFESKVPVDSVLQEIITYNRNMLPGHKANLQHAVMIAQNQLQQANILAAEKEMDMSIVGSQPSMHGITRFHEYSTQPKKTVWEGNQLPQRDYMHKLNLLRKKFMGPEIKGLWAGPPAPTQGPRTPWGTIPGQRMGSIAISGKGCSPYASKRQGFPVTRQPLRHN
ncbi:golgin subfamily A member 4 isoform X2 [Hemicordylus capensis]|uniref:golgin subfamily A member 4 isoform X2 n=1 Tax=Hemicordylus capensis TaxID=884348 RepID=UPI002302E7F1|nr:golgin subfamily A member 4 isoform X2 [Hemicordylus capensis]